MFFAYPRRGKEVTPRLSLGSMADRSLISGAAVPRIRRRGALLPRLMDDREPGGTQRPRRSPQETKGLFFDCSAEGGGGGGGAVGGITLPND